MKKLSLMVSSKTGTAVAYDLLGGQTGYLPISSVVQCYKKKKRRIRQVSVADIEK